MRWVLAGLAFALLVTLSVFTVAIRTRNFATRAHIAAHNDQIVSLRVERASRAHLSDRRVSTGDLIDRLRQFYSASLTH